MFQSTVSGGQLDRAGTRGSAGQEADRFLVITISRCEVGQILARTAGGGDSVTFQVDSKIEHQRSDWLDKPVMPDHSEAGVDPVQSRAPYLDQLMVSTVYCCMWIKVLCC